MITPGELAEIPLFAALPHALRSRLAARAGDIHANAGEWIIREGDAAYFWVMLEGEVETIKIIGGKEVQTTTFDPGEFFGEVPLLLSTSAFLGVRALKPSRLARIDPPDFRAMVADSAEASALLAQTLSRRVNIIREFASTQSETQATIIGDRYDFACHDVRDFLSRNQIAYEWLDPNDDGDRGAIDPKIADSASFPVVVLADGRQLQSPSTRELAAGLGLQVEPLQPTYDVIIIGGGPAGLAAAVYGGSEGLHTMMIEREAPGGQAGTSSRIENYLGFPGGVSGGDLANRALMQAKRFGTEILVTRSVESIETVDDCHTIVLDGDDRVQARAVVIATGVTWRELDTEGAHELIGRGVYYGAARTEALATRGKDVFLIGGGNSAGQAAMFFSNYARSVTLLIRGDSLEKSMSAYLIDQLKSKANISVETQTVVTAVGGAAHIESITTTTNDAAAREREAGALFVFIGADAETSWLPDAIERDARGYIRTGRDITAWSLERPAFALETSVPGIFAAGDVRSDSVKRVAAGVGEGSMVIAFIHQHLDALARTPSAEIALTK